jgi:hypothetical protein
VGYRIGLASRSLLGALFFVIATGACCAAFADEKPAVKLDVSRLAPKASAGPAPPGSFSRTLPDPPAITEKTQWVFELRWDAGDPYLVGVNRIELPAPQATPRAMGRFAVELYEGKTLLERVRFDFPGLGAGLVDPQPGKKKPVDFEKKLKSRIGVLVPATKRGTRLELWDRASDRRWSLPWPIEGAWRPPAAPAQVSSSSR